MPLVAGQSYSVPTRNGLLAYIDFLRSQTFHLRLARGCRTSDTTSVFGDDTQTIEQAQEAAFIQRELLQIDGYAPASVTMDAPVYDTVEDYAKIPRFAGNFTPSADWTLGYDCACLWLNGSAIASKAITAIDTGTDTLTCVGHGLSNLEKVMIGGDNLPGGTSASQMYQAINVTTDTFKISTNGTDPVNITSGGTNPILKYAKGTLFHLFVAPTTILAYSGFTFPVIVDLFLGSVDPETRELW